MPRARVQISRRQRFIAGGVAGFFVIAAIAGVIGNRADALFVWLITIATEILGRNLWLSSIVIIMLIAVIGILIAINRIQAHELDAMTQLVQLDDSLLRLLPNLAGTDNPEKAQRKLLTEFLRDTTRLFDYDAYRAYILAPNAANTNLVPIASYQLPLPPDHQTWNRFYIADVDDISRKRGLAGKAFLDRKLEIAHLKEVNGRWTADTPDYAFYDIDRPYPPYLSLVAIPLIGLARHTNGEERSYSLGVVCFDSRSEKVFDPPAIQELLLALARRIAATMLIYQQLTTHPDTQKD